MDVRAEMTRDAANLSDHELDKELSFATSFGADAHENAPLWIEVLTQEKQHRETGEPV